MAVMRDINCPVLVLCTVTICNCNVCKILITLAEKVSSLLSDSLVKCKYPKDFVFIYVRDSRFCFCNNYPNFNFVEN